MKLILACLAIAMTGSSACIASESVYRSAFYHGNSYGTDREYVLIAPYYTDVETHVAVGITKSTATNSNQNAKAPTILYAKIVDAVQDAATHKTISYKIKYAVSCDLTSVVGKGDTLTADNKVDKLFQGAGTVDTIYANNVTLIPATIDSTAQDGDHNTKQGGSISDITCPSAGGDTYSVAFSLQVVPKLASRRHLYWKRNPFFDDAANIGVDANGMLSNAQSASQQEITAIITELAGTAASIAAGGGGLAHLQEAGQSARKACNQDIISFVKNGSYFGDFPLDINAMQDLLLGKTVTLALRLDPNGDPAVIRETKAPSDSDNIATIEFNISGAGGAVKLGRPVDFSDKEFWGIMVFLPVPVQGTVDCFASKSETLASENRRVLIAPSTVLNLYADKRVVNPTRDFLTNPQDSFTFSGGIISGHKYTGQSAAKTIIDTITAPIRAIVPSVNVTQSQTIQSNGQKSTTTSTTTGAPKSQ
jgi:hypothetical protein